MKTDILKCKICNESFNVFINKDFKKRSLFDKMYLPNCRHHGEVINAKPSS